MFSLFLFLVHVTIPGRQSLALFLIFSLRQKTGRVGSVSSVIRWSFAFGLVLSGLNLSGLFSFWSPFFALVFACISFACPLISILPWERLSDHYLFRARMLVFCFLVGLLASSAESEYSFILYESIFLHRGPLFLFVVWKPTSTS